MKKEVIILRDPYLRDVYIGGTGRESVQPGKEIVLQSGSGEVPYDVKVSPLVGYWVKVDGKLLPRNLRLGVATDYGFAYREGSFIGERRGLRKRRDGWK